MTFSWFSMSVIYHVPFLFNYWNYMCISKNIKPTIIAKIIRSMRILICKWNLFTLKKNPKKSCFYNNVWCRYFLLNISFITIIWIYKNSDNEPNRKSAMINIIKGWCRYNFIVHKLKSLYMLCNIQITFLFYWSDSIFFLQLEYMLLNFPK